MLCLVCLREMAGLPFAFSLKDNHFPTLKLFIHLSYMFHTYMVNSYLVGLHSPRPALTQNREKYWLPTGSGPLQSSGPLVSINPVVSTPLHMLSIKV